MTRMPTKLLRTIHFIRLALKDENFASLYCFCNMTMYEHKYPRLPRTHQLKVLAHSHLQFLGLNPRFCFGFCTEMLCHCTTLRPTTFQESGRPKSNLLALHKERMKWVLNLATLKIPDTSDDVDDE